MAVYRLGSPLVIAKMLRICLQVEAHHSREFFECGLDRLKEDRRM